jgi:hypothetical protein
MHSDLIEKAIARRLRTLADEPTEAPYDWAEFARRRQSSTPASGCGRNHLAAMAAAVVAVVVIVGVATVRSSHQGPHTPTIAKVNDALRSNAAREVSTQATVMARVPQAQARTRAIEGWLAGLPHDPAVVRVGTHVAVTSLQDQIAELDDLMSAERVAGAQPSRLDALERQRAQLVSSLAQLRYAEMLASANP